MAKQEIRFKNELMNAGQEIAFQVRSILGKKRSTPFAATAIEMKAVYDSYELDTVEIPQQNRHMGKHLGRMLLHFHLVYTMIRRLELKNAKKPSDRECKAAITRALELKSQAFNELRNHNAKKYTVSERRMINADKKELKGDLKQMVRLGVVEDNLELMINGENFVNAMYQTDALNSLHDDFVSKIMDEFMEHIENMKHLVKVTIECLDDEEEMVGGGSDSDEAHDSNSRRYAK